MIRGRNRNIRQYQIKTDPLPDVAAPTVFQPFQPWSLPGSRFVRKVAATLIASGFIGVFAPAPSPAGDATGLAATSNDQIITVRTKFQYQAKTQPVFVPAAEVITVDKWAYPWSEPVRQKPRLNTALQSTATYVPVYTAPGSDHLISALASSNINYQLRLQYQSRAEPYFVVSEVVTLDKWYRAWENPVRIRRLQAAQFDPVTIPEFIEQNPGRWHQPWSEPVRTRRFAAALQDTVADISFNLTQLYPVEYPWSEPVRIRKLAAAQFDPVTIPEFIEQNPSRWHQPWSEPVRFRRFHPSLQETSAYLDQNPDFNFESKWHQPWSEPARFRRFPTAEQQPLAYAPFFVAEVIYEDKWHQPWSEPVRLKPGLRAYLQEATAYLDQNPDFNFESKWHQPWTEPVRLRRLATAQIDPLAWPERLAAEVIYYDKWGYPWSEPVRQKRGLRPWLQQFDAYLDQNPDFNFESKWHQPWTTPVRFRRLAAAQFDAYTAPEFVEGQQPSRWLAPWSEPVRQKRGLRASLQDWFAYLDRNPDDATFESKWHQPWSSPVRIRRIATALQQSALIQSPFFAQEVVTVDKWFRPLEIPVRVKSGLFAGRQQFFAASLESVKGISWYQDLSQPRRTKFGLLTRFNQSVAVPAFVPAPSMATWLREFAEPVRQKRWLRTALHQAQIAPVLDQGQLTRFYNWHAEWALPKQLFAKPIPLIIPAAAAPVLVIANQVELVLDATEVNNDAALFAISVYNPAAICLVSIKEIQRPADEGGKMSHVTIIEMEAASVPPTPTIVSGNYLIEDASGFYTTEDGTGFYVIETSS